MRLLQRSERGEITLTRNFVGDALVPPYAILSHTWGPDDEEVTFEDMVKGTGVEKDGYKKIAHGSEQALQDGLHYFWVDTCCIDKSSSSELSESINSMYAWYKRSKVCYVYLNDVTAIENPPYVLPSDEHMEEEEERRLEDSDFAKSRWFTRGWTLQELLAPDNVEFFSKDWTYLGNLKDLLAAVLHITKIDQQALVRDRSYFELRDICVARRMSWAAKRQTSRVEDRAYCLLGIFGVQMPLLYGEGSYAFVRLQEEVLKRTDEDSILAWNKPSYVALGDDTRHDEMLAPDPSYFGHCDKLIISSWMDLKEPLLMSNVGLTMTMRVILMDQEIHSLNIQHCHFALGCRDQDDPDQVYALPGRFNPDLKVQSIWPASHRASRISKLSQQKLDSENRATLKSSVTLLKQRGATFETRLFAEPLVVIIDSTHCDITIKDYYPSKAWIVEAKKLVVTEYSSAARIAAVRLTFGGEDLLLVLRDICRVAMIYGAGMKKPIMFRCPRGAHSMRSLISQVPNFLASDRHVYQGPLEFRYMCRKGEKNHDHPILKAFVTRQRPRRMTRNKASNMAPSKRPNSELGEYNSAVDNIYQPLNHTYQ
jgi:hypothetical protein